MRLNKFLADSGIASRRGADEIISAGRVRVNGAIVREMGVRVDPETDRVEVDGTRIGLEKPKTVYFAVNKPVGYVSTTTDRYGEQIVTSLVPFEGRLYPVGRLDKDSEGLMILTNDGDFAYKMMHPKHHVLKTYRVVVRGKVDAHVLDQLQNGVELDSGRTAPCKVTVISSRSGVHTLEFQLGEGKKRQIRKMCAALHLFVLELVRTKIGSIELGDLPSGKYVQLSEDLVGGLH